MNSIERELFGYVNGTEKMSGFDSYDSMEGDYGYFDDDDMNDPSSFMDGDLDEMSFASGSPMRATHVSDPYVIQYENTTAGTLTAVLYGYNDYFGASNYGNPTGIVITNLQGGTYGRLIAQSNNKFFKIGKWRFQASGLLFTSSIIFTVLSKKLAAATASSTILPLLSLNSETKLILIPAESKKSDTALIVFI